MSLAEAIRGAEPAEARTLAAIDIGSNSIHMAVATVEESGTLRIREKYGEKTQLAAGLDPRGYLDEASQQRALDCLKRFGQRLASIPRRDIRIVATSATRVAKHAGDFTRRIRQLLGVPVEVISGREEARLIYVGVSHSVEDDTRQRLVMDIGGGSTEFIIGKGHEALEMESLHMGCVGYRERFFPNGRISRKAFNRAVLAAELELQAIRSGFRRVGWEHALGSSGSVKAIEQAVRDNGLAPHGIPRESLDELVSRVLKLDKVSELSALGIKKDRHTVFVPALAIMQAAFNEFGLGHMDFSDGALREGVLFDLYGRLQNQDIRESTVRAMQTRHAVDTVHAERVAYTASTLFDQLRSAWQLDDEDGRVLGWAAALHEVGLSLAHSQYHKHGEYIVRCSDMLGFGRRQQARLATLVRTHRRKCPPELFEGHEQDEIPRIRRLSVILRLAVLFNRARSGEQVAAPPAKAHDNGLVLSLSEAWCEQNPLTLADLQQEQDYLKKSGFTLGLEIMQAGIE
ncbi:MAG: Ppx/GppA family phosphatase [Gammaproteobacteria bacterium]|nr:MAG: Ppx/GppA family phosphatase [Gammaproteobacteria bacterium]